MAVVGMVNANRLKAALLMAQGDRPAAVALAQEALDLAERLDASPSRHELAGDVRAKAAFTRAMVVENAEASLPHWQRALELFEAELAAQPDDAGRMRNVALVEKYLGARLDTLERHVDAEQHYRRALTLDEARFARDPGNRLVQFDVAIDLSNVAGILEGLGRLEAAREMFARSLELRRQLVAADPRDELSRGRLAYARMRMARIELRRGRRAEAMAHVREAIAHHEAVIARTDGRENRAEFASALVTLAEILPAGGAESCAAFRRAHQTFEGLDARNNAPYAAQAAEGVARCDRAIGSGARAR